ncbi:hypothetical protein DL96DRAFT_1579604, partial [Flagelloscypha sp. PMI_526]
MSTNQSTAPREGHIRLVLFQTFPGTNVAEAMITTTEPELYLDIPIEVLNVVSPVPRKYLRFIAFAVLGYECTILHDNVNIGNVGSVEDRAIYYAHSNTIETMDYMVDHEVNSRRSSIRTKIESRNEFAANLQKRDGGSIFAPIAHPAACHIIPFARGNDWLDIIVKGRPCEDGEDLSDLESIDDIRNGFLSTSDMLSSLYLCELAVIKTPNRILETTDLRHTPRPFLDEPDLNISFPNNARYTLHYLVPQSRLLSFVTSCPPNIDAKFKNLEQQPAAMLLHYHYGNAALRMWGNKPNFPKHTFRRPQVPA